ncbi:MAG: hypothetical protein SPJ34_07240, partial [Candidatus Ornithospirochaeta sp.]|nr:hypothetical protein [Candidatus Ornithospirochaeta sp.]
KTAQSSIRASNIAMMPGSDMFISDAVIRIGRVPILYLPFFFFPGSRPLGNPAFGFSSARGAFLNTTFEIFGSSSRIDGKNTSSSFTALLKGAQGENEYPTGPYYSEKEEESDIDKWARSSKSYMAIMADAYEKNGIHLGLDSALSFFDKKLKISIFDGIALSPMTEGRRFRYYGENTLSFDYDGLTLSASFPFYSDQRVLYDYANRLTVFSIDPILGNQPEFPSSFSSSKTSFTRSASLSYRLPSKLTNDLIKSLSISKAEVSTSYARKYVSNGIYKYIKEKTLLPSIELSLSGTIWSASYTSEEKKDTEEKDETEIHIIKDPLLYEIYKEKASSSTSAKETYSASLGYTFSESLENRIEYGTDEEKKLDRLYSKSTMKLLLNASMSSYFSLESSLTPSFQYIFEEDSSTGIATDTSSIISDVKMSVPAIGLSYRISSRLFSFVKSTSSETYYIPGWNKETITAHSLSLSKSIDTAIGRFTPSLSYAMPPLSQTLSPKLSYSFGNASAAFSWKFKDDSTGFKPDLAELSLGYNGKYIVATAALKYQSASYTPSDFFNPLYGNASLTLRSADKSYSVMEYVEFENATNQFKSIKTTFRIPSFSLSLNWKGAYSDVRFREIAAKTDMKTKTVQFWKGRIYLAFSLSSSFYIDIENPYSASFSITPAIDFSIAEFLDFRFSFTSVNNNFGAYIDAGSGAFSFRSLFEDLLRSLDIFTGGNRNTNFVLNSLSLEAVHYMEDWDLHCKYSTEVVLSGYKYDFVPKFSVFLSWNTLPDLKVDQKWKKSTTGWVKE